MNELKQPTKRVLENQKFLSKKVEIIMRAAAKELENNNDPLTLIKDDEPERTSRKRRYSVESSDCDATQVEDLPGYSPELKKRHRLNSNSFIYLEGNEKISENSSSNSSEVSENIPVESLNINRGLKEKEFEVCFNDSFIENLAQNINKAKSIHKQTPAKPDEIPTSDANANQESSSQTLTGNILDELIRNVLEDTDNDPTFHEIVADAVGEFNIFFIFQFS